jgi:hypothetical protein
LNPSKANKRIIITHVCHDIPKKSEEEVELVVGPVVSKGVNVGKSS